MLDRRAIEKYHRFIYGDGDVPKPIPPALTEIHQRSWAMFKACGRAEVPTEGLIANVMLWTQTTKEGMDHLRVTGAKILNSPAIFQMERPVEQHQPENVALAGTNWKEVGPGTPVVVTVANTQIEMSFISVTKDGEIRVRRHRAAQGKTDIYESYKPSRVSLANAG
jgi:hypothetical protein